MADKKESAGKGMAFDSQKVGKGQIFILIMSSGEYNKAIVDISKKFADNFRNICYVSLNKPYAGIKSVFEANKIDEKKFIFVDPHTKGAASSNVIPVESISALTGISIAITNALGKSKADSLILDSLSTMLIYNDEASITKFMHFLVGKMRAASCTTVLTLLESDTKSSLVKDLEMFVDGVITLGKGKKRE